MKNIPFSPPDISQHEIEEVVATLKSGWLTTGPRTKQFEQHIADYCGTKRAVCLNSATAALELTLRVLGIGAGDEIITTAYTYTATASVIAHVGAKIVMIDVAKDSLEMDYDLVEAAITERTKAIIAVDIAGMMCRYDIIKRIVERKKSMFIGNNDTANAIGHIAIIADAAHSLGASRDGIMSGSYADFSCFSFHAVKNLTTGEGGAVTFAPDLSIDVDKIYKEYMLLSLHGQSKDALAKTTLGEWEYDIISPAYKCNMTDIMAAIGLAQLTRYPEMLKTRHTMIKAYDAAFEGTNIAPLRHEVENALSSGHLYIVRIRDFTISQRNLVIKKLAEMGIAANVHYKPLPLLTAYKDLGFDIANYPNAYAMYQNAISLPLHTLLTLNIVEFVASSLISAVDTIE